MHYSKGINTKQRIMTVSRHLFYEQGYKKVTIREISAASEVNLGLLNYYFNGKGDLGMTIYKQVRAELNEELHKCFPDRDSVDYYFLSSAIELMVCLHSRHYGDFYLQMSREPKFKKDINETIISTILRYSAQGDHSERAELSSLSTMATKPALVEHFYAHPGMIGEDAYLQYYMEMQFYQLRMSLDKSTELLSAIQSYYFNVGEDFVPVIAPVAAKMAGR